MKPLINDYDIHVNCLIDEASPKAFQVAAAQSQAASFATSDLIDTACKKLSLLNGNSLVSQHQHPQLQPSLQNYQSQLPISCIDLNRINNNNNNNNSKVLINNIKEVQLSSHGLIGGAANGIIANVASDHLLPLQPYRGQTKNQQRESALDEEDWQEHLKRKPSFFVSTTSTNYGHGKNGYGNSTNNNNSKYYLKNQQHQQRSPFSPYDEKSKLLHHDEKPTKFPIRYIIVIMSTLATFVSYTIRVNMSVTLVAMVNQSDLPSEQTEQSLSLNSAQSPQTIIESHETINQTAAETIIKPITNLLISPDLMVASQSAGPNLDWSESIQGVALGAFYWGFILTHVLGGQLANIFSARIVCATSILTASLLTLILPKAATFSVYAVILLRMVTGLCLGIVTPALYTLSSRWVPQSERSTAIAVRMIGGNMGAVTAMSISGYLSDSIGWQSVFYVIGGFGCIVFLFWIYLVSDSPQQHRWTGARELQFIEANTNFISVTQAKSNKLDWVSMLKSPQLWAVAIAKFCGSWGNLMLMQKLPTYLEQVLQMPIGKNGLVNAMVYIALSASLFVFGLLSDYVCSNQPRSQRTTTRVLFELVALLGPAICLAFVPFMGHSQDSVIALLVVAMILYGLTAGGDNPIVVEIAPDFPGTTYGVTNAVASVPGFMAPIIVGLMLDSETKSNRHQWNMIFFITSAIYALGGIAFMLMANADAQPWGVADSRKKGGKLDIEATTQHQESIDIFGQSSQAR